MVPRLLLDSLCVDSSLPASLELPFNASGLPSVSVDAEDGECAWVIGVEEVGDIEGRGGEAVEDTD